MKIIGNAPELKDIPEPKEDLAALGIVTRFPVGDEKEIAYFVMSITDGKENSEEKGKAPLDANDSGEDLMGDLWRNKALNCACHLLDQDLKNEVQEMEWHISDLMGPGYGDEPIERTGIILEITGASSIGVFANEEGIMTPKFTRCGYYILAKNEEDIEGNIGAGCLGCRGNPQGCVMCGKINCNS